MGDALLNFLGIARRAGKLIVGLDPVLDSINKGKSVLIITAKDISKNTYKSVVRDADSNNVPLMILNRTKDEISFALGKLVAVASIEDAGFAKKIIELNDKETVKTAPIKDERNDSK